MAFRLPRKLRIIVVVDETLIPPQDVDNLPESKLPLIQNELDVITTLQKMGHEVKTVGVAGDMRVIRTAMEKFRPRIAFNLLVEMHNRSMFEPHIASYMELLKLPYTGCNPRGLLLARDKALTKKILSYHRVPVPSFHVFPLRRKIRVPRRVHFPLVVKSVVEEGSTGISQASIVHTPEALVDRVEFVQRITGTPAIAEEYIEGREIYAALIGNQHLQMYTPWELFIKSLPEGVPNIATSKVKWDLGYQKRAGVETHPAELTPDLHRLLARLSRRIYRILNLSGYARLDFRMKPDGTFYLLEANPNPDISWGEDFAEAAEHSGVSYEQLLQRILNLGLGYRPEL
jgi:D-alanine-D-alanine ligase